MTPPREGGDTDPCDEAYDAAIAVLAKYESTVPRWVVALAVNAAFDAQARANVETPNHHAPVVPGRPAR